MVKEPSNKFEDWRSVARSDLYANTTTPEASEEFEKASSGFISMSLVKILKDFNLTRSFKNVVNFYNTRRLPSASATTTTTSTMTTCCRSAASELPKALLRLFEA